MTVRRACKLQFYFSSFFLVVLSVSVRAQEQGSIQDLLRMQSARRQEIPQLSAKTFPLDAPVDPAEYYVGPGDVLALNIWSSSPVQHQLTITPEGTLLIPNVGVVDVRDKTLEFLKKDVARRVGSRYPTGEVTLTLISPRRIIVQITGDVYNEGKHEVSSLERADGLIALANTPPSNLVDRQIYNSVQEIRVSSSLRNIVIQRKDAMRVPVDLIRYKATGRTKYNPYLREGDQVFVPSKREMKLGIGIGGGIRLQGSFEFIEGDSLSDLIAMGFGFRLNADSTQGTFTRLSLSGEAKEVRNVNPAAILAGNEQNIALRPGDRLVVIERREERGAYIVAIEGAVKYPRQYPITSSTTRLSEAIGAAGGFSEKANIKAATLTRARLSPQGSSEEIVQERLLSARSSLGVQDSNYYFTETALRLQGELVSVDFHKLFVLGDSTQDVTLRNFDKIVVPQITKTVYVFGQVLSPGHTEYVEGRDYRYYVQEAGGYASEARDGDVKIIKGSTRVWLDPSETKIEDGDYIWIPKERDYPFAYHLNTWAQIAGIIGTVATVALLVNNLTKP